MAKTTGQAPAMRSCVERMIPYIPGEQPKDPSLVKLNTNENPYPPAPGVLRALESLSPAQMRKYPDPLCVSLREAIGRDLNIPTNQIVIGNGSDEILKMYAEAFVDAGDVVAYLWPTYSLYPVFVEKAQGRELRLPWRAGERSQEEALRSLPDNTRLVYLANPNPPIGLAVGLDTIAEVAERHQQTLFVIDEAYIAYGGESAVRLVREGGRNIAVSRTFSKSHSLAGMRLGFAVGPPPVIDALYRVKDSYNLSVAAQVAGLEAWNDHAYTADVIDRIKSTRRRVTDELRRMNFGLEESQGNFVFARHPDAPAIFERLRENQVLVRYFKSPELADGLRITIGTDEEMNRLLEVLATWLGKPNG